MKMNEQDVINDFTFKLYFHFSLRSSMKSKVQYTTIAAFTLVRSIWVINPLGRGMVFLRLLSLSSSLLGTQSVAAVAVLRKTGRYYYWSTGDRLALVSSVQDHIGEPPWSASLRKLYSYSI